MLTLPMVILLSVYSYSQNLSLQQCIDSAVQHNYSVRMAGYDVMQANEKIAEAKANLLPKVNMAADYRYYANLPYQFMPADQFGGTPGTYKEVQFGVPHNINANVQLNYPVFNASLLSNIKAIQAGAEIAGLQKIKSQEDVAMDVSNVYYNAQVIANQILFIDSNIVNSKKLLTLMELLYQQKMANGTDVEKVSLQLSQLFTQKETAEIQYSQVLNILKFLMGMPADDKISIESNPGSSAYTVFPENPVTEIKLSEKQISFLQTEKESIQKSKLPVINLNALYGTTGFANTGPNDFLKFHSLGYAGLQVAMPLYTGNVTKRKIKGKELEIEKARVKLDMLTAKTNVDRTNISHQLTISKKNLTVINQQIRLAQTIYTKTLLQQKEGIATLTDVLLADNAVREAQQNYINALVVLRKAELEYRKLTGNLLIK
jgi:OMF family outer membrane factor